MSDDKGPSDAPSRKRLIEDMDRLREAAQPLKRELLAPLERLVAWMAQRLHRG